MFHPRNDQLLFRARELRKNMTPEERMLWYQFLRNHPVRFRRQEIIGNYIADFYCARARLVIELDGAQHYEPGHQAYDVIRTMYLKEYGLTVIRIPNSEVNHNLRGVCEFIDEALQQSLNETPQSP